ncbi:hypothetical protein BOTCAL_0885g00020 [Botryotinia calthae]|uniref:Uncharacterized protein n=1 Tax=Botryotinia calthae TaxID=38488 RepID=A0A4Y8CGY2_9HELO|nr:hypothetical protein BOTCAL_0885g00020 [Botryotinia calthae]
MSILNPCISKGLRKEDANTAEVELSAAINRSHYAKSKFQNPWVVIEQGQQSRNEAILKDFLEMGDNAPVADLLHIPVEQVDKTHIVSKSTLLCVNTIQKPFLIPPVAGTPFKAFTFIALGDSSYPSGLPGFGNPPQQFEMNSGQALHASVDAVQVFRGELPSQGGGFLFLIMWK